MFQTNENMNKIRRKGHHLEAQLSRGTETQEVISSLMANCYAKK